MKNEMTVATAEANHEAALKAYRNREISTRELDASMQTLLAARKADKQTESQPESLGQEIGKVTFWSLLLNCIFFN